MTALERRCRWLLHAYPARYRRDRGEKMVATLLKASPPSAMGPSVMSSPVLQRNRPTIMPLCEQPNRSLPPSGGARLGGQTAEIDGRSDQYPLTRLDAGGVEELAKW